MTQTFDAIVIGAGQAGPPLAGRLTAAGMKTALIERKLFGGTCVNTGCMPTKTLVASAYAAHLARRGADFGVMIDNPVAVDMKRVKARADNVAARARTNVETWLRGMNGLTVIEGHARFEGPDTIRVGDTVLKAPRIFINVGGRASIPDMPGVGMVDYLTNTSILKLETLPQHLVVVGGSYIGLEFAQMYRRFGAEVTVVEKGSRLVAREDEDVSEAIRDILTDEGITVRTNATCIGFKPHPDGVAVDVDCTSGDPVVVGSHVLLAVGRRSNTASGLWAIATGAAPSRTRPTTTTRSSPPICSMTRPDGSATGYRAMPCISIRRSAASGCQRRRRARQAASYSSPNGR
jgi:pyruvate/2-oxoglutarate dehydrogenase complex dihydrolipoamide dehydrogenase (E3) component